jgi:hypothetical protein
VKPVKVNRKRLNRPFMPLAINDEGQCLILEKYNSLSSGAIRLFNKLLSQCSGLNRVVHHSTEVNDRRELCELVTAGLIARPTAAQHPRRRGFTTVLINPHLVLTTDDEMYRLWSSCGLSPKQQELQP